MNRTVMCLSPEGAPSEEIGKYQLKFSSYGVCLSFPRKSSSLQKSPTVEDRSQVVLGQPHRGTARRKVEILITWRRTRIERFPGTVSNVLGVVGRPVEG